jgi:hypothetical protein
VHALSDQFDVYFRFGDADPFATSIQCPLDHVTGCFLTANRNPAILTAEYSLLPGVLHAYKATHTDLATYVAPYAVPEPGTWTLQLVGLAGVCGFRDRRSRQAHHE